MLQNLLCNSIFTHSDEEIRASTTLHYTLNSQVKTTITNYNTYLNEINNSFLNKIEALVKCQLVKDISVREKHKASIKISEKQKKPKIFSKFKNKTKDTIEKSNLERYESERKEVYIILFHYIIFEFEKYNQFVDSTLINLLNSILPTGNSENLYLKRSKTQPTVQFDYVPLTIVDLGDFIEQLLRNSFPPAESTFFYSQFGLLFDQKIFESGYEHILLSRLLDKSSESLISVYGDINLCLIKNRLKMVNALLS